MIFSSSSGPKDMEGTVSEYEEGWEVSLLWKMSIQSRCFHSGGSARLWLKEAMGLYGDKNIGEIRSLTHSSHVHPIYMPHRPSDFSPWAVTKIEETVITAGQANISFLEVNFILRRGKRQGGG